MALEVGGWKFDDFPQQVPLEVYEQAKKEFVQYFRAIKGVSSIYRYGSVTYPGLSDLDFMVLLDDNYRHRPGIEYSSPPLSPQSKYVVCHQQFFMPRHLYPIYPLMLPIFEMEHVWGEPCQQEQIFKEDLRLANTLFVCEDVATKFPEFILGCLTRNFVRAKYAQAQLNLVTKFSRLVERVAGRNLCAADPFEEKITRLRKHWFSRPIQETCLMLKEAIEDAAVIVCDMGKVINDYVMQSNLFPASSRNSSGWTYRYSFLKVSFSRLNSAFSFHPEKGSKTAKVFAPLGLMLPLVWLSSGRGPLSQYIRNQFEQDPPKCDLAQNITLQRIVNAQNAHCRFLKKSGVAIQIFGYFSYHSDYFPGIRTLTRLVSRKLFR